MVSMNVSIITDRLYSISLRPHELAELGGDVRVSLRYAPVADDDAPATRHFKLLVLELTAATHDADGAEIDLQLLKCGWELELASDVPCAPSALPELAGEVMLLLSRIAAEREALQRELEERRGTDRVERIGSGSAFVAPLELVPEQARIEVWIAGAPVGTTISVSVNGTPAGPLAIELPDLADPSYRYEGSGLWRYDGWRRAVAHLPAGLLRSGDNAIGFDWADTGPAFLGLKDLVLQLRYPAPVPGTTGAVPAPLGPGPDFAEIEPATPIGGQ